MRADSWFQRHLLFAFALPFFRLRYVFATPSDRLRHRPGKALGISNLRSDSPLDFVDIGRSYLDPIGASNGSSTLGSLGVSYVVIRKMESCDCCSIPTHPRKHWFWIASCNCRPEHPERWDNQLSTNVGSTTSHNRDYPMCVTAKPVCF